MKKIKSLIMLVFITTITFTLFACKGGGSGQNDPNLEGGSYRYFATQNSVHFNPTAPVFKMAQEYAKIKEMKGVLQASSTNVKTLYNTTLADKSKDGMMHMVTYSQETIEEGGLKGSYADLTDLIKNHAPNIQKYLDSNPIHKKWATASDGKIYGIPFYTAGKTAKGWFVRNDYIEKLKEKNKIDQSFDINNIGISELENLMTVMKANAALLTNNKTTSANFYPYFDEDIRFNISELVSLWGAYGDFAKTSNTKVIYGPLTNEYKTAIESLARWYDLGLIGDNLFIEHDGSLREKCLREERGAITHDWMASTLFYNQEAWRLQWNQPSLDIKLMLPPKRADDTRLEITKRKDIGNVTAINSLVDEVGKIRLIKWMDFFFTPEGKDALNFGVKDVTYSKIAGKYKFSNKIVNEKDLPVNNLLTYGAQMNQPGVQDFKYEQAWATDTALASMEKYTDPDNNIMNPYANQLIYPHIKLDSEKTKSINEIRSKLERKLQDYIISWVKEKKAKDGISTADWDKFKAEINKLGAQQALQIYEDYLANNQ